MKAKIRSSYLTESLGIVGKVGKIVKSHHPKGRPTFNQHLVEIPGKGKYWLLESEIEKILEYQVGDEDDGYPD